MEPSHLDLHCLTFSLSALHIYQFIYIYIRKGDDKCGLKFGAERVKEQIW